MPMPVDLTPLAATSLARKWKADIDVSVGQDGSDYRRIKGVTEFTYNPGTVGLQPDSDYDANGFQSSSATTIEHGGTMTVRRGTVVGQPTTYDPGQEFLRAKALLMGQQNTVRLRIYEYSSATGPKVEAYEAYYAVAYANGGGDQAALSTATVTLTGQGINVPITHPDNVATVAPTVSALAYVSGGSNVAAAGGDLIRITGTGFLSATTVTVFGNVVATANRSTINDNTMVIKVPAHAAGTGNVTVTNAAGTSATATANQIVYV